MKKVSILIPAYNTSKYIAKCIESALCQTYRDLEIIVIDDGSTDNTANIVQSFAPKVILLTQSNQGPSSALNSGLKIATGDYIALLDSDDYMLPEKIDKQVEYLNHQPNYGLVYTDGVWIDEKENVIKDSFNEDTFREGYIFKELFLNMFVSGPTMMIPRSVIRPVGFFDPKCREQDYQMALRIAYHYPIGYLDEKVYVYRWHDLNSSKKSYVMAESDLFALLSVINSCPGAEEIVGQETFRKRLAEVYYRAARAEITNRKNFGTAKKYLIESLKFNLNYKTFLALLASLLGLDMISPFKSIK